MFITVRNPWTSVQTPLTLTSPVNPQSLLPSQGPHGPGSPLPLDQLMGLGSNAPGMTLDVENDWQKDGCFVGAGGQTFAPEIPWKQVPPVRPNNGKPVFCTVVMVNGIMTDVALQASDMQKLANTGCNVIGIHNATRGMTMDLMQCMGDKLDLDMANNGATATAAKVVAEALNDPQPPKIVGHSQGALVVSNALGRAQTALLAQGLLPEQATVKLKALEVTTLGGASWTFPEGPRYNHFVNYFDAVPMGAGVGAVSWATGWTGDKVIRFGEVNKPTNLPDPLKDVPNYLARVVDRSVHGPQDVYIPKLVGSRSHS